MQVSQVTDPVAYHGEGPVWSPSWGGLRWVDMLASMYAGKDGDLVAWDQALTSDMAQSQPVIYEVGEIKVPTLLLIGMKDKTALGKERAPPEAAKTLGDYATLAPQVAGRIHGATLVAFDDLGHAPQIEAPDRFNAVLLKALGDLVGPAR